jgi:hypothetical protein
METLIDFYISSHFADTEEKRTELIFLVISNVNLSAKKNILAFLLRKDKTNTKEDIKKLLSAIDKIIIERNVFAHSPILYSTEGIDQYRDSKVISYVVQKAAKFAGELEVGLRKNFTELIINQLVESIESVNSILRKLNGM